MKKFKIANVGIVLGYILAAAVIGLLGLLLPLWSIKFIALQVMSVVVLTGIVIYMKASLQYKYSVPQMQK